MRKFTFTKNGTTFVRIPKDVAKRLFENGEEIVLCPWRLRPGGSWFPEYHIARDTNGEKFDALVNAFEYYNCVNSTETGFYSAFYVSEKTL